MQSSNLSFKSAPSWHEAATEAALEDLARLRGQRNMAPAEAIAWRTQCADLENVVASLIALMPRERQNEYRARAAALFPVAPPKGGRVHNNVVNLFARSEQREWTAPEVQAALAASGEPADAKAVLNALGYLNTAGKIRRVARGRYLIEGALLVCAEDIPGTDFGHRNEMEV